MAVPRADGPLEECLRLVGHHALGLDRPALAEAVAGRAGALRAVERERARRELRHGDVAPRAGELLREEALPLALDGHEHDAGGEVERLLQARAQALEGALAQREAVDEHVDAVRAPRVEPRRLEEARRAAVDARALQAGGAGGGELLAVAALPPPRDGRRHHRDEAVGLLHEPSAPSRRRPARRSARRSAGSGASRGSRRGHAGGRRPRSPCRPSSAGGRRSCAARWRSPARGRSPTRRPGAPSARGTAAPTARGSRRSAAGPRRRACRRRGCSCRTPRGR